MENEITEARKKRKASNGRGYIQDRGKGVYRLFVYKPDGKRHTETVRASKSSIAKARLTELLSKFDKGETIPSGKTTMAEHLQDWIDGYVKSNCTHRTLDGYQSIINHHLIPAMGHVQLKHLTPKTIQNYYSHALELLSSRTVHHHHRVLSQSLKYAVRQGYLIHNPCELTDPPSPRGKTMRTMTAGEVETFLATAVGDYYYPVFYTAVSSGLRQAELLALRWRDIDLDYLSISVNRTLYKRRGMCEFKEPKTEHSRRRVSMTPKLSLFLRQHKAEREALYNKLGKQLSLDDLAFGNTDGKPLNPASVSRSFLTIARKAGIQGVRFHDLRHTFASLMLQRGANPKVISEALGHSSVAFTLQTYSHIIKGMQEDAMSLLNEVLPAGMNGPCNNNNFQKSSTNLAPIVNITTSKN